MGNNWDVDFTDTAFCSSRNAESECHDWTLKSNSHITCIELVAYLKPGFGGKLDATGLIVKIQSETSPVNRAVCRGN